MKHSAQLHGFIPIAPVGTRSYTPQQYQSIQVRAVILGGWEFILIHKPNKSKELD
jgi:hypothetical protein